MPKVLALKKNEDRRLLAGHLWIYSNEIDITKTALKSFNAGELVRIENAHGKFLGIGYVNPHALICARLLTQENIAIDKTFLHARIKRALTLREQVFAEPYYRLLFGESDGLPGVVIDRYDDIVVMQITTAGMEKLKPMLVEVLQELIPIKGILLRNDSPIREMEKLPLSIETLYGYIPEEIIIKENHYEFIAPLWKGQKTGWFYDHRSNRAWLQNHAKNKRVLDVFSYLGAWSIPMAKAGASEVVCIDSSAMALEYLYKNAERNECMNKISILCEDAFEALKQLHDKQETFDIIIIDPPAFIKSRKHFREGLQGYQRLNELALKLVASEGWLVSASCSMHLSADNLADVIRRAGLKQKRDLRIIAQGHQAADHPIHPAMPETNYLKMFVVC